MIGGNDRGPGVGPSVSLPRPEIFSFSSPKLVAVKTVRGGGSPSQRDITPPLPWLIPPTEIPSPDIHLSERVKPPRHVFIPILGRRGQFEDRKTHEGGRKCLFLAMVDLIRRLSKALGEKSPRGMRITRTKPVHVRQLSDQQVNSRGLP